MRTVGLCTSSRSERGLMEALNKEIKNSELYDIRLGTYALKEYDIVIIPADRSEMTKFALECFHSNIPFCHYLAGSITHSHCHDDVNRWMISSMANFCFAESPQAKDNLIKFGIPDDRITVTGTSNFDGVSDQDIENNKPKNTPIEPYDLVLLNPETQSENKFTNPEIVQLNNNYILVQPNEDYNTVGQGSARLGEAEHGTAWQGTRLEFLWLLKHCDHFISNSSTLLYEVEFLNKYHRVNIKVMNPSQRNSERTPIPPEYCKGASKKIAEWCEKVDLEWLKLPKQFPCINAI